MVVFVNCYNCMITCVIINMKFPLDPSLASYVDRARRTGSGRVCSIAAVPIPVKHPALNEEEHFHHSGGA